MALAVAAAGEVVARAVALRGQRYFETVRRSDLEKNYSVTGLEAKIAGGRAVG